MAEWPACPTGPAPACSWLVEPLRQQCRPRLGPGHRRPAAAYIGPGEALRARRVRYNIPTPTPPAEALSMLLLLAILVSSAPPSLADQPANTWVKRSPLPGGPPSPRLGYESTIGYDPVGKRLIRWGGH